MNSRERVLKALNHEEPDRVPFDLGGTVVTGIHATAYVALREYMSLPKVEPKIIDILQQLAQVDDDVMGILGVDVKNIAPRASTAFEMQINETDDGRYTYFYDEWNIGWRMPKEHGFYYDMFDHPLSGEITAEDVDNYQLPDPNDPARYQGFKEAVQWVREEEQRAVVVGNMAAGIYELYMWTRSFEDGYADFVGNIDLSQKILHRYMDLQLAFLENTFNVVGEDGIDVIQMADDMAGQYSMLISPASYRQHLKPLHKEMFDFIKERSSAKIFFHSCGSIRSVIPDLIEVGVDIINPVQVSAAEMDAAELKQEFGNDLVFWGGGVDTQNAFDERHTPDEVREDVKRRIQDLMPGGGFVFNTVHNIQANVPPENVMAMWETLQDYGKY